MSTGLRIVHGLDEIWILPAHEHSVPGAAVPLAPAVAVRQLHAWSHLGPPNWVENALRHVDGGRRHASTEKREQLARMRAALECGRLQAFRVPVVRPAI